LNIPSESLNEGLDEALKSETKGALSIADAFCLSFAKDANSFLFCNPF